MMVSDKNIKYLDMIGCSFHISHWHFARLFGELANHPQMVWHLIAGHKILIDKYWHNSYMASLNEQFNRT